MLDAHASALAAFERTWIRKKSTARPVRNATRAAAAAEEGGQAVTVIAGAVLR
jgi:hypothetical protein